MAARPSWDGFLKFNLISVPVKAYTATVSGAGKIGFHLIHRDCNSRIRYKKVCPIHGEIPNDEIVTAYEYAKGQYIVVEQDERKRLRVENDKAIAIDTFIAPDAIDPMYFTERNYYLVPDGKVAQKPYAVLLEAMAEDERWAVGQVVFSGQGRVALVRPLGRLLAMTLLSYADQLKKPSAFEDEVPTADVTAEERKLARTLIEAATARKFDLADYSDEYIARLTKLLQARGKGKKVVTAPQAEEPAVINLMDALRQSLKQAQHGSGGKKGGKTRRRKTA
jgi:DNA end-binding protein Ku